MTKEEFASRILNFHVVGASPVNIPPFVPIDKGNSTQPIVQPTTPTTPTNTTNTNGTSTNSIDWRIKGAVTSVKNQGSCGSCWAFSSSAQMESFNFIKNGKLVEFSQQ